ncbi:hypothetical protein GCM10028796_27770 [Ramlibacter monticola]|jgi:hypothetical protein|uniref:FixH family protein n=1 Tax=Ramlibacter monticola TaxID=1926872 RepID=A0A937CVN6_9BURK|nr:FixH family protein [Ramlibacter monticola]MBL0393829.1 FixH family protein [Ramlibacter monticola]
MSNETEKQAGAPWWKYGHVWLLIAGPATVVVAGFVTAWIAVKSPDPVVEADYYRRGIEINKTLAARDKANLPALQGRNHAAAPTQQP